MDLTEIRSFLLWCAIINYGVLLLWFSVFCSGRSWLHQFHGRWFRLSSEQFDAVHYACMAVYKIGILMFNVVPVLALYLID